MRRSRRGITFVELMIVLGFVAVLATVVVLNPTTNRDQKVFDGTVREVISLLREAQARAMAQSSSTTWGVRFDNTTSTAPFFALFWGVYSTSTKVGHYALPPTVMFATSSLALGAAREVAFAQLTGAPTASTSIGFRSTRLSALFSTIVIASSGLVVY